MSSSVERQDDVTLVFRRRIQAPRALVFEASLSPAALAQFYPPTGYAMAVCDVQPSLAGSFTYGLVDSSGRQLGIRGIYVDIDPPNRIQHTEEYDFAPDWPELLVTLTLTDAFSQDGRPATDLQLSVKHPNKDICDQNSTRMPAGVDQCYARLEAMLLRMQPPSLG